MENAFDMFMTWQVYAGAIGVGGLVQTVKKSLDMVPQIQWPKVNVAYKIFLEGLPVALGAGASTVLVFLPEISKEENMFLGMVVGLFSAKAYSTAMRVMPEKWEGMLRGAKGATLEGPAEG